MSEYEVIETYLPKCKGPVNPKMPDKISFWMYWKIVQKETGMLATNRPVLRGWYLKNRTPAEVIDAWSYNKIKLKFINAHKKDALIEKERKRKKKIQKRIRKNRNKK